MGFLQGPRATVYVAPPPSYSRNIKALLHRANWEKGPHGVLCLSLVSAVALPHFCITMRTFPRLLVFSAHLCTPPVLEAAGAFTQQASTDSPITLAELLVDLDCILPQ